MHYVKGKKLGVFLLLVILALAVVACGGDDNGSEDSEAGYILTVQAEGGGSVIPEEGDHGYKEDTRVDLKAAPADGWEFREWIGDVADTESAETTVLMDGHKTVKAVFEESEEPEDEPVVKYTLDIEKEGKGVVTPAEGSHDYDEGTSVELKAAPADSWEFKEWIGEVADTGLSETTVKMNEDKAVTAVFEEGIDLEGEFAGGSGTEENPYLVATPKQLDNVRDYLGKHFKQIADIDLGGYSSGAGWNPIGEYDKFTGTFDGNGYKITNLVIDRPGTIGVGLFKYLDSNAALKNIALKATDVTGKNSVGGLVGTSSGKIVASYVGGSVTGEWRVGGLVGGNNGDVVASYAQGSVIGKGKYIGGLVGEHEGGEVANSYSTGDVTGDERVGGLVGQNENGEITNSYAGGGVTADGNGAGGLVGGNNGNIASSYATGDVAGDSGVGGLAGYNNGSIEASHAEGNVVEGNNIVGGLVGGNNGDITGSYATGDVTGGERVGGLVGQHSRNAEIANSYAQGSVTGEKYVGGLVGGNWGGIEVSYSTGNVAAEERVGGLVGGNSGDVTASYYDRDTAGQEDTGKGIPKTTSEMMQKSTFEGWDFNETWDIDEGSSYPSLQFHKEFAGGRGTEGDPYLVATAEQLDNVRDYLDKHFRQIEDIDLSDYSGEAGWTPIGKSYEKFTGTFDGNGYTITDLTVDQPDTIYIGLFGYIDGGAALKNMALETVDVIGDEDVGGLVGHNESGEIKNSYVDGNVAGNNLVGGLVGYNGGDIVESYATVDVTGNEAVGGLAGYNEGKIAASYAAGTVTGKGEYIGGLVGDQWGSVTTSYAAGSVTGEGDYVGGLIGDNWGEITASYYDRNTTGQDDTGKGIPRTTSEMMQKSTFEGWDFNETWDIDEGSSYPSLQWE